MSWAMNSDGVLCSMDALFWGGVGGSGTPWFPVAPGITSLPAAPTVSTGSGTPANAMTTPSGFNPTAPGSIWSTLPAGQAPSYAKSVAPAALVPVVSEKVKLVASIKSVLAVEALDYPLTLPTGSVTLVTKAEIQVAALLNAEAAAFSVSGQAAALNRGYRLTADAGTFIGTGFGAGSVRDYSIGTNAGTYVLDGQNAIVAFQRNPLNGETGSFVLSGQDSFSRIGINLLAEAGDYSVSGNEAALGITRSLAAEAAAFVSNGQDAQLTYVTPVYATATYTGNATPRSINVGFKPGLVIFHKPTVSGWIFDYVRGAGKYWITALTSLEVSAPSSLTSFDASGFSIGSTADTINDNGVAYTALCWKEGDASSANTSGTISSTTRLSSAAGYSVFTYTGNGTDSATVGHGLGVNPELLIIKVLTTNVNPASVFSRFVGSNTYGRLNSTAAWLTDSTAIKSTTDSVVTLGASSRSNLSGASFVGYAFASVSGVSKIGTYSSNGAGVFSVSLGFQPRFILVKGYLGGGDYFIYLAPSGGMGYAEFVSLNASAAKQTSTNFQITSTGFSVDVGGVGNVSGGTSSAVYMAYA